MEKLKSILIGLVITILIGFGTQQIAKRQMKHEAEIKKLKQQLCEAQDYVPSIKELQQRLCNAGYPVKVDGIWGRETEEALKRCVCDRYAREYFEDERSR